ncbi:MAG TPA: hypothetical protein VGZ02_09415 [Candidatus Baltobacteraceae bacterium]|jgi:hypothetical protein|nr:hypothetical protein [Candidatus Baltobacteraceae bacterium]
MILPFTPPAAWTQLPLSATSAQVKNVWQRNLAGGKHASFGEIIAPLPINPSSTATSIKNALKNGSVSSTVSAKSISLCGVPAQLITVTTASGSERTTLEQQVVTKGGYTYMLTYTRPTGTPADPAIVRIMHTFCPGEPKTLAALPVPASWKSVAGSGFESMGTWLGTAPMQTMVLLKGPQMPSLSDTLNSMEPKNQNAQSAKLVQIVSRQETALCGRPAMFITMRVNVPSLPMEMQEVITQANGTSYALLYSRPLSEPPDAAAVASLHTLCAMGVPAPPAASPSAMPSSSPAPLPSPAPMATLAPTPSASPTT